MKKYLVPIICVLILPLVACATGVPVIAGQDYNPQFDSLQFSRAEKYALVLAGGGAKGSYEAGVFRAMKEINYPIDIVTGTSVGALNSIFIVMDDLAGLEKLWRTVDETMIFTNPKAPFSELEGRSGIKDIALLFKDFVSNSADSYQPLKELLKSSYKAEKFYASPIDFGTVVLDIKKLSEKIILKKDIAPGKLPDYMLASAACYPAFQPYEIDGTVFIDGGYVDNLPLDVAKKLGGTHFVAVGLGGAGNISKESQKILESPNTIFITPYWSLGSLLYFNPKNAERNMRLGYLDALKVFGAYEGRAYTFLNDTFDSLHNYNTLLEPLVRLPRCLAFFNAHWENRFYFDRIMLTAAEAAAELLDMNPLFLYRADIFNHEMENNIKSAQVNASSLKKNDSLKILLEKIEYLKTAVPDRNNLKELPQDFASNAQKQPKEFFAAVYIYFSGIEL